MKLKLCARILHEIKTMCTNILHEIKTMCTNITPEYICLIFVI